jgi:ribosomal protein L11 methylase PrmA
LKKNNKNKTGTGAGIIAMKRLRLDIAKVIYVDTDKVARHVYRSNHDKKTYNSNTNSKKLDKENDDKDDDDDDDGNIEHVFEYESFESIYENLDAFMEKHGRK